MAIATHTWKDFKSWIDDLGAAAMFHRGQSEARWGLVPTYYRLVNPPDASTYWTLQRLVHDYVSTWTGRKWNLDDAFERASFLGFLQHNGFPTPLLDWTLSPYVAAYFAFDGVNDSAPNDDNVAIFAFDHLSWSREFQQIYDVGDTTPHVSVLQSESRGNQKQLIQQGAYTYSTVSDQEIHIRTCESQRIPQGLLVTRRPFLEKVTISVHEKPIAMRDFQRMGITAMGLFPGAEGLCHHLKNLLFPAPKLGLTPQERTKVFLESLATVQDEYVRTQNASEAITAAKDAGINDSSGEPKLPYITPSSTRRKQS